MVNPAKARLALRLCNAMTMYYRLHPDAPGKPERFEEHLQVERAVLEWVLGERDDPQDLTEEHVGMLERAVLRRTAERN
jgi:hypothetical protein